jgi:hypothetical protein
VSKKESREESAQQNLFLLCTWCCAPTPTSLSVSFSFYEENFVVASLGVLNRPYLAPTTRLFRRSAKQNSFPRLRQARPLRKSLFSCERKQTEPFFLGCVLHTHQLAFSPGGVAKFFVVIDIEIFRAPTHKIGIPQVTE